MLTNKWGILGASNTEKDTVHLHILTQHCNTKLVENQQSCTVLTLMSFQSCMNLCSTEERKSWKDMIAMMTEFSFFWLNLPSKEANIH